MSFLVKTPKDGFSDVAAHIISAVTTNIDSLLYESLCDKTELRDFRPGLTQTGLCSHRSKLGARKFGRGVELSV